MKVTLEGTRAQVADAAKRVAGALRDRSPGLGRKRRAAHQRDTEYNKAARAILREAMTLLRKDNSESSFTSEIADALRSPDVPLSLVERATWAIFMRGDSTEETKR